jgi:hypothetical protein
LATLVIGTAILIAGQTSAPAKTVAAPKAGPVPKTPWGEPDLQGTWFVLESVPLERPAQYAGRTILTEDEVAALDKQKAVDPGRNSRAGNTTQDVAGAYNAVFNSVLKTSKRTSMIIDPPDGKIPPLTAEAQQRQGRGGRGGGGLPGGGRGGAGVNDNPETVAQSPRCLGVQMPFLPLNTLFAQGTVMQIVQSPKSMGIYMEDDHAAAVIASSSWMAGRILQQMSEAFWGNRVVIGKATRWSSRPETSRKASADRIPILIA